ncbi:hypothetical protein DPMN_143120 [Dreissena polymorpha]|uniref:Uncharacterized protein n=1 Tax=Dreissena polymorpha TaxID=45954 RepID=A0A9D4GCK2_DREPO|nr:hypothetical protein DPMN_143120 [Dreissena polymorpha]
MDCVPFLSRQTPRRKNNGLVASQSNPTRSRSDNIKFWGQVTAIHASRLHLYFVYINSSADDADVHKYYVDNDVYDGYGNDDKCEDYDEYDVTNTF